MKLIDIFYQLENNQQPHHLEARLDETVASLKARIIQSHGLTPDVLLFLEDADELLDEARALGDIIGSKGGKVHVHRCKRVAVTVAFAGRHLEHSFGPGSTIARIKRWATNKLGMSDTDATEHVFQITGTHERPTPSTHVGTLVHCPDCRIAFDLVADQRVNG